MYNGSKTFQKLNDDNKSPQKVNDGNKTFQKLHDVNKFPQKVYDGNKTFHKLNDDNKSPRKVNDGNKTFQKLNDVNKSPQNVNVGNKSIQKVHNVNKSLQGDYDNNKESVQKGSHSHSTVREDRIYQEKEVHVSGCKHWFPLERGNGNNLVVQMASKINPAIGNIVSTNGINYLRINTLYSGSIESNFCKEFCDALNGGESANRTCNKNILISCNLKQTIPGLQLSAKKKKSNR